MANKGFMDDFRRFFLRGLVVLVPTLVTFAILVWVYQLVNNNVAVFMTEGLVLICSKVSDEPPPGWVDADPDSLRYGRPLNEWDDRGRRLTVEHQIIENYERLAARSGLSDVEPRILQRALDARNSALWHVTFAKYRLHLLGFVIAIVFVYFVGFFLASFIGRASWRALEGLLRRIPLIRAIFPSVKQVTDFLLTERKQTVGFSSVVAVQYPRKGVWSIGLSTGAPLKQIQERVTDDLVTVFVPSSPTPFTGYIVQIPRQDVIELDVSVDEALRFTISAGVIKPGASLPAGSDADGPE